MSVDVDYYELLEVERTADEKAIKSSYRRLAMRYHPDRNAGCPESEAKFKAISEAYDCLKDPQKRALYDRYGKAAFEQQGGGARGGQGFGDFADIFESFFGDAFGQRGGGRGGQMRGADLRYDMEISLADAFHGKSAEIAVDVSATCEGCTGSGAAPGSSVSTCYTCHGHGKVRAQQGFFMVERSCPTCHGRGEVIEQLCRQCGGEGRVEQRRNLSVEIPAGVDDGTRIRLSGKGEAGARGAPPGDLYIFLHIARHPVFQREGTTLFTVVPVSFTTAALGGEITIPGIDGEENRIVVPDGIQSGEQLRKRGAGMPVLRGRGRGDMVIQIEVETPTRLSSRQKELLREFRETETGEECPKSSGFFSKLKDAWSDLTD